MKIHIYAIKNLIDNKVYIGSTKSFKSRKYQHLYRLNKGIHPTPYLQHAYNTYGKDKFAFYTLEECTSENRKEREIFYINQYKSSEPEFGYNSMPPNGDNFTLSKEHKAKLINNNWHQPPIAVDAYKIDGTFIGSYLSTQKCAKSLNLNHRNILRIVGKKGKQYKGYTFFRKGEPFSYIPSSKQRDMSRFHK